MHTLQNKATNIDNEYKTFFFTGTDDAHLLECIHSE